MAVSAPMLQLVGGLALLSAVAQACTASGPGILLGQALFSARPSCRTVRTHLADLRRR